MTAAPLPPAGDRRRDGGLVHDPATGRLSLGGHDALPDPAGANRAVLVAFVELAARCRGDRVANLIQVRHEDAQALADALDLDAADLEAQIAEVLNQTRVQAQEVAARLKAARSSTGLGRAATALRR